MQQYCFPILRVGQMMEMKKKKEDNIILHFLQWVLTLFVTEID